MKTRSSIIRLVITGIAAGAMWLGAAANVGGAQINSTTALPPVNTPQSGPAAPAFPHETGEVVKIFQGGISKDIIVNYINTATQPFHLTADDIIRLQKMGVPDEITKTMLVRDRELQDQRMAQAYQQPLPPAYPPTQYAAGAGVAQPPVVVPTTSAPDVAIGGDSYPYDYGYYGYPYYSYSWPLYIGGGWGWGHGWSRGFHGGIGGFHGGSFGAFHGGGVGAFHSGGSGGFHGGGGGHGGGGHR